MRQVCARSLDYDCIAEVMEGEIRKKDGEKKERVGEVRAKNIGLYGVNFI